MSSIFLNNFYPGATQKEKLQIIEDIYNGNSLQYFKKRYVNESDEITQLVDWNRLYESSNYMEFAMRSYTNYIKPATRLKGFNKKLSKEDLKKIKEFYKSNNWRTLVNQIGKFRKMYGDVYLYWYLRTEDKIPMLKIIPSKYMEIKVGQNQEPISYIFKKVIYWDEPSEQSGTYTTKNKTIQMVFRKGGVDTYENGALIGTEISDILFSEEIPIIHFQYEKMENSPYSIIPSEDLIDPCISLDRAETDISDINHCAGFPTQVIVDGKVNAKHSRIGASSIFYVDSLQNARNQAKVSQFEITNSLESLYREREEKLFMLFTKANLIPPEIIKALSKSDSSKVISSIKESLADELRDFYEELSEKTKVIFKALLPNRKTEEISLEIPKDILTVSTLDKAVIIKSGIDTIQNYLREQGKTEDEIERHLEEVKNQNIAFTTTVDKNDKNEKTLQFEDSDIQESTNTDEESEKDINEKSAEIKMDNKLK